MRRITLRLVLPLLAALAAAGCKEEGVEGPTAICRSVGSGCSADADCCSYGCRLGACLPNPLEGGACRTHDDCGSPRVCVNQQCTSSMTCLDGPAACDAAVPCCSGVCSTGLCTVDRPPVADAGLDRTVPYRVPLVLENASTDPDTGLTGLSYSWAFLSVPEGSAFEVGQFSSVRNPTFTPDVVGDFVVVLEVTKGAHSPSDTVTIHSVNTPPVPDAGEDITTPPVSRNVARAISGTVSDADGGPVTCTWTKTPPGGGTPVTIAGPTPCAAATGQGVSATFGASFVDDVAGIWTVTLVADDGVNPPQSDSIFVTVVNDPPVANAGPKRYGNLDLGAVPLHGTATDVNGDVTGGNVGDAQFTWSWAITAAPQGSTRVGEVLGATPSITFTPELVGTYTLTLTVDDGHGGPNGDSATSTVEIQVEPFMRTLGEVVDAEYVKGTNRVVVVEMDATTPKLKLLDPEALAVVQEVVLAGRPTSVGLDPTQTEALVGLAGGRWQKVTGIQGTLAVAPTVTTPTVPVDLVDVVHTGTCGFGLAGNGNVYELFLAATDGAFSAPAACPTCTAATFCTGNYPCGHRGAASATKLWLLRSGGLSSYDIHTNCNLQTPATASATSLQGAAGLWLAEDGTDLYTTRPNVFAAGTLAERLTTQLPAAPDHLSTTLDAGTLVGAVARTSTFALSKFTRAVVGGAFTPGADAPYPILGWNGDAVRNYGQFAFVQASGDAYYAIVRADVGVATPVYRWSLVKLGP
jgi:hypothetical protein